jgi:hypothetical protein
MKKYLMCPLLQGADNTWVRDALRPYFGTVPRTITLKASTGCNTLKDVNGKAAMDHGCLGFAILTISGLGTSSHSRRSRHVILELSSLTTLSPRCGYEVRRAQISMKMMDNEHE